jgi:AcrR family transcriptional regulator
MGGLMKSDTTQKIIESAANHFFLEGFGSVSMDSIAETANVTKVTVYQHFRSKEELFLECLRWRLRSRETQLDARCAAMPCSATGILEIFDWMADKAARGQFHGCAFLKATSEMACRLPEVRAIALESKHLLRRRLIAMLRESGLQDANGLGHTFALLLEGAQALSVIEQNQRPFKTAKRAAQNHLDRYSSATPGLPGSSRVEN